MHLRFTPLSPLSDLGAPDRTKRTWRLAWLVSHLGVTSTVGTVAFTYPHLARWRAVMLLGIGATLLVVPRAHQALRLPAVSPAVAFCGVVFAQLVFIATTGGITSPFVIAVIPPAIMIGILGLHELDWVPPAMVLALVSLLVVELVAAEGGGLASPVLGGQRPVLGLVFLTVVLAGILMGGFRVGCAARRGLDAAHAQVVEAQRERAELLSLGNADLFALTGAIAHELKNPLTTLLSLTSYLQRRSSQYGLEREADVMLEEVRRVRERVNELLNLSRPVDGLSRQGVDLQALVRDVVVAHTQIAQDAGVRIKAQLLPLSLEVDRRKIRQILDNLVQNAIEASPSGCQIQVVMSQDAGHLRLDVLDEGSGLADEIRGRLFVLGNTTKPTGSGIGLAVSRAIALQHGGSLELEDRTEGGCRARVSLPLSAPIEVKNG